MAINFLNDVSFNKNEIIQPVLENQANDASAGTPEDGQLYYDTTNNVVKYGEGGSWIALSASTPGNGTLSITAGNGLSGSDFTFTANQSGNTTATLTVGEGTGISVASGSVGIDYIGTDNAILAASAATPASADTMWFSDSDDNTIKKATITNILALAPQGDITAVSAGDGITVTNSTGPIPSVAVDYTATGLIADATDGTGVTLVDADDFLFLDDGGGGVKYANLSQLKTYISAGDITGVTAGTYLNGGGSSGSVTLNHDSTTRSDTTSSDSPGFGATFDVVSSVSTNATGHVTAIDVATVTLPSNPNTNTTYTLPTTNGSNPDIVLTGSDSSTDIVNMNGTSNEVTVTGSGTNTITFGLPDDVTIAGELTVSGTGQSSFAGQVTIPATPSASTDAASKGYVDGLVSGGLTFKGTFRADTGEILSGTNSGSQLYNCPGGAGTRVAVAVGDYYLVATAGGSFFCSGDTLDIGDSVIGVSAAGADSSVASDFSIVQSDEGVVSLTTTDGTYINLTPNSATAGAVTVTADLSAADGTADTSTRFLSKDNTWDVPAYTSNVNTTYDLLVAQNSGSNNNPLLRLDPSSGSNDDITLTGGTNITVTRDSATSLTIATSATTNTGTVTSVGITDGYLMDTTASGSNPITGSGTFTLDVDLSELTDMAATLSTSDEAVILDVSETGKDQGKRITWAEVISDLGLHTTSTTLFTLTADSGSNQTVVSGNTVDIAGGTGISTAVGATDTVTITNDGVTSLSAGAGIDVSASTGGVTVSGEDSTASNKGIVIVAGGSGIDVSYSSGTATVSHTSSSTGGAAVTLADATSGVSKSSSGGFDIYTITTATVFGATTDGRNTMVEVMNASTYETVYAEITRSATTVVVTFKGSITDGDYRALLYSVKN
jgi:hypothetical protein